jgi:hypothetical protein
MMGKYGSYQSRAPQPKAREPHPIWRGIGFVQLILTPILGFASALVLIDANSSKGWVRITKDMLAPASLGDRLLYIKIGLTLLMMLIIYGILQLIVFVLYRFLGPPRYGPLDIPPVAYKGKVYKR